MKIHCLQNIIHLYTLFYNQIVTQENGAKVYGVCFTTYQKATAEIAKQFEKHIEEWNEANVVILTSI
jgi:NADH:ubiquinone oxidoreductase subunit E